MRLSRLKALFKANRLTKRMWNVSGLVVALVVGADICTKPAAAEWKEKPDNTPIPRYFDKRLRTIEDHLIKSEWDYLQTKPKVENCPPQTMERYLKTLPPQDLSKIAIWSNLALRDNPRWHESLYHSVYYGAIWELGQRKGREAEKAIIDIAYQSTIDTHPAEALTEAWERCTHTNFKFGAGVHPRFLDESLNRPMSEEAAKFVMPTRILLISNRDKAQIPRFKEGHCTATFDIMLGGHAANIRNVAERWSDDGLKLIPLDAPKNFDGLDKYLKSLRFPSQLPCGLKKVRMSVQFY